MKLFLDWESYYDKETGYDLRTLSNVEYVRHESFKAHGLSVAWDDISPFWVTHKDVPKFLKEINWSKIDLTAHQTKFDGSILWWVYGYKPRSYICTKAMSRAVLGKRVPSHSLEYLSNHFGLTKKDKSKLDAVDGIKDLTPEQESKLAGYCCDDTKICRELFRVLERDFPASQYRPMSWTIKAFVEPKLILDVPLLETTARDEEERRRTIFERIGIGKKEFSSNPKFSALLQKEGFSVPTKVSPRTKKNIPAFALGDTAFVEMVQSDNDRLRTLCEARIAAKSNLMETRSVRMARIGATGPWPFDVEFSGADQTHRLSGGGAAGGNPQNLTACRDSKDHKEGHECPGRLRMAVKAPEICKLVVGDFSKVEPRLVANLSRDPALLKSMEKDPYLDFASAYYGRALDKHVDYEAYKLGKEGVIALGYQLGHVKFKDRIKLRLNRIITLEESKATVDFYRYRYRKVKELWGDLNRSIGLMLDGSKGTLLDLPLTYCKEAVVLPSGLKIQYPNLRQEPGEYGPEWVYDVYEKGKLENKRLYGGKFLENICQALAGELTKGVINKLYDYAYGQLHDEVMLIVEADRAESLAEALEIIMSESPPWLPEMKLGAECGIGDNWLSAKS